MIAYCGINCDECPAYNGTVEANIELFKKASKEFNSGKLEPIDWVCLGCKEADIKLIAKACKDCKIRSCATKRGFEFCAVCPDFMKCSLIQSFIGDETSELGRRNKLLHDKAISS